MMKRALDIIFSLLGLVACFPLFLIVAILIKLDSPGPVFFLQIRIGKGFKSFTIYKFRTMVKDAAQRGALVTVGGDARITRVGSVLRKSKLDEVPQLINVLKGEMSLVGPRPEVPRYVEMFRREYQELLAIRPGITDLSSLKYIDEAAVLEKAEKPEEEYTRRVLPEKLSLAKTYLQHASFIFDLAIIAQTVVNLMGIPISIFEIQDIKRRRSVERRFIANLKRMILWWRRPLIMTLDIALIVLANYCAFWLRFDGRLAADETALFLQMLPWLVLIRGVVFFLFRLNEGLWRYTSLWDLQRIIIGVVTSTIVFYVWVRFGMMNSDYPRSIYIVDSIVLIGFLVGIRLPARVLRGQMTWKRKRKVLVYGAGDSGERVVREMKSQPSFQYEPIGFVDDDLAMVGQRIHGVRVLGTRKDLPRIILDEKPEELVLALPKTDPVLIREIVDVLGPFNVAIKKIPQAREFLDGISAVSQIRNVLLEDLLPRVPVGPQPQAVRQMVLGKCILVTGAGGSIGSELCRQICEMKPHALILYERHENSLYSIAKELSDSGYSSIIHPIIGDITDVGRLYAVMEEYHPHILFHAAAHKHVPLMEYNAGEALKNNCIGTRVAAESAKRFGVERFVLISTDKAVNPSSVMGATKRAAELVIHNLAGCSKTKYLTVRFGNVLGSNGSVVLRFKEQIEGGGPVTVTHPDVKRYFMLISEAVHLVLQAAMLGEQGCIYVLDMGEQIRVLDLARNVIRLSGYVPDKDIPITFIGLRPGEKLIEELVGENETIELSPVERIFKIHHNGVLDGAKFIKKLLDSEHSAILNSSTTVLGLLRELVPAYQMAAGTHDSIYEREVATLHKGAQFHQPMQEATAVKPWRNALRVSSEALAKEDMLRRASPKKPEGPRL